MLHCYMIMLHCYILQHYFEICIYIQDGSNKILQFVFSKINEN